MPAPPSRPDPQFDDLVRRLRVWPLASWQHGDRIACTRIALQQLADLAADADARRRIPVPELSPMALADQLAVLGADALHRNNKDNTNTDDELAGVLDRLTVELGLIRRERDPRS